MIVSVVVHDIVNASRYRRKNGPSRVATVYDTKKVFSRAPNIKAHFSAGWLDSTDSAWVAQCAFAAGRTLS